MVTQVSCKLTNSLLSYFERQGVSAGPLFELFDGPDEFLRDTHFWLEIPQVERIFEKASRLLNDPNLGDTVGSQVVDLQSWGALDSVFKMIPSPRDYYVNLGRFFSYFLAPLGNFREIEVGDTFVRFRFPIARTEYPFIFDFLKAVLENLPRNTGHLPASSDYSELNSEMLVNWDTAQPSLFGEEPGKVMSPKLIHHLTVMLESTERALEQRNRELLRYRREFEKIRASENAAPSGREKNYADKMAGLAQLAAGVAHEINNPLSYVMSNLQRFEEYFGRMKLYLAEVESAAGPQNDQLLKMRQDLDVDFILEETPGMLKESRGGVERVKEIVKDLSNLAHPGQGGRDEEKSPVDLNGVIDSSIKVFQEQMGDRISIQKNYDLKKSIKVFPVRLSQVVMNLLSNAIHAIPEKGKIDIKTLEKDNKAVLEISDSGVGMEQEMLDRIFTPFYTTKEAGRGMGLGLSIAQSIVDMHQGAIDVVSHKGQGSKFTVTLPMEH